MDLLLFRFATTVVRFDTIRDYFDMLLLIQYNTILEYDTLSAAILRRISIRYDKLSIRCYIDTILYRYGPDITGEHSK